MTESIRHMYEKLKSLRDNDTLFLCGVMILVGSICFYLGRESVMVSPEMPQNAPAVRLVDGPSTASVGAAVLVGAMTASSGITAMTGEYVASKSGTKYHHVSCPGAAQIHEENKVFFASPDEAEAVGYTRAANCTK